MYHQKKYSTIKLIICYVSKSKRDKEKGTQIEDLKTVILYF